MIGYERSCSYLTSNIWTSLKVTLKKPKIFFDKTSGKSENLISFSRHWWTTPLRVFLIDSNMSVTRKRKWKQIMSLQLEIYQLKTYFFSVISQFMCYQATLRISAGDYTTFTSIYANSLILLLLHLKSNLWKSQNDYF